MKLKLTNSICFFDLEATGTQITKDRIVQIAIIKINPDGKEETYSRLVNPTISIPKESTQIHGISDEDIKDKPTFSELASEIIDYIGNSDLAGYNSNKYDIPLLAEEFLRCNIAFDFTNRVFIDVQNIFHKMEQRTLAAAYQFYCGEIMENAHDALYDTQVTWSVFKAQLEKYDNLDFNVQALAEFSRVGDHKLLDLAGRLALDEKNNGIYNFGKHKGKTIKQVMNEEPGYYGWMLDADFPLYTKQCLRKEMEKIKTRDLEEKEKEYGSKLSQLKDKFGSK
ncbi:MAG: exonuclease domain-containing protein [Bacteroidota bacterium]